MLENRVLLDGTEAHTEVSTTVLSQVKKRGEFNVLVDALTGQQTDIDINYIYSSSIDIGVVLSLDSGEIIFRYSKESNGGMFDEKNHKWVCPTNVPLPMLFQRRHR